MNAQGALRARDIVKFTNSSIFEVGADAICNPVNCQGVSSKGLALEFKERYPAAFGLYRDHCRQRLMKPGGVFTVKMRSGLKLFHVATKKHWYAPSDYQYIRDACVNLIVAIKKQVPFMVAVPMLGCGLGGLSRDVVREILLYGLQFSPRPVVICDTEREEKILSAEEAVSVFSPENETPLPKEDEFLPSGDLLKCAGEKGGSLRWWDAYLIGRPTAVRGDRVSTFLGIIPGVSKADAVGRALEKWPQWKGRMKIKEVRSGR